jgi:hypothetical protein
MLGPSWGVRCSTPIAAWGDRAPELPARRGRIHTRRVRATAKCLFLALLLAGAPGRADEQEPSAASSHVVTLLFGVGAPLGGLGLSVEGYLAGGQASVFGGLGYIPSYEEVQSASRPAFAGGARYFFRSDTRHRLFVEGAFVPLAVVTAPNFDKMVYGMGGTVGYQYLKDTGLTFMASAGLGFAVLPTEVSGTCFVVGLGLGYTWSR